MAKMIFVNLPVADLAKSKAFYEAIGLTLNPLWSDETAVSMVWSEHIYVMLLSHAKWKTFTTRPIAAAGSSEVALAITLECKDDVNRMVESAAATGGVADINPPEDHGFMFQRSFADLDGHIWEPFWMDPAAMPAGA